MVFLGGSKVALDSFFAQLIQGFRLFSVPQILTDLQIRFPYMPRDDLLMSSALCTLAQIRTTLTYLWVALVLTVTVAVGR